MLAPALTLALALFPASPAETYAASYKFVKTDLKAACVTFEAPGKMSAPHTTTDKFTVGKKSVSFKLYGSGPAGDPAEATLKYPFVSTVAVLRPTAPLAITATTRGEIGTIIFNRMKQMFKQMSTDQLTKTLTQLTKAGTIDLHSSIGKADYYTAVVNTTYLENGKKQTTSQAMAFLVAAKPNTVLHATMIYSPRWTMTQPKKNGMNEAEYAKAAGLLMGRHMKSFRFTKP